MAYLRRLPNSRYWIAGFNLPDGRRTQRSTKEKDRKAAIYKITYRLADRFGLKNQAEMHGLVSRLGLFVYHNRTGDFAAQVGLTVTPAATNYLELPSRIPPLHR
jgi:hypothetical protein